MTQPGVLLVNEHWTCHSRCSHFTETIIGVSAASFHIKKYIGQKQQGRSFYSTMRKAALYSLFPLTICNQSCEENVKIEWIKHILISDIKARAADMMVMIVRLIKIILFFLDYFSIFFYKNTKHSHVKDHFNQPNNYIHISIKQK